MIQNARPCPQAWSPVSFSDPESGEIQTLNLAYRGRASGAGEWHFGNPGLPSLCGECSLNPLCSEASYSAWGVRAHTHALGSPEQGVKKT